MAINRKIKAFRRENGRVGVRNHVIILPVDDISNACAEKVAAMVPLARMAHKMANRVVAGDVGVPETGLHEVTLAVDLIMALMHARRPPRIRSSTRR